MVPQADDDLQDLVSFVAREWLPPHPHALAALLGLAFGGQAGRDLMK